MSSSYIDMNQRDMGGMMGGGNQSKLNTIASTMSTGNPAYPNKSLGNNNQGEFSKKQSMPMGTQYSMPQTPQQMQGAAATKKNSNRSPSPYNMGMNEQSYRSMTPQG